MSDFKFKLDYEGVKKNLLNADFMQQECEKYAKERAQENYSSKGYHLLSFKGTERVHVFAFPNTKENPG